MSRTPKGFVAVRDGDPVPEWKYWIGRIRDIQLSLSPDHGKTVGGIGIATMQVLMTLNELLQDALVAERLVREVKGEDAYVELEPEGEPYRLLRTFSEMAGVLLAERRRLRELRRVVQEVYRG